MTLVHDKDTGGRPALHALVIGVGHYPWLDGGEQARGPTLTQGMGQLDSPSISATAFCDWLITEYRHCPRRLATVDMLLSHPKDQSYAKPLGNGERGMPIAIDKASLATIKTAARRWKKRGRDNAEDMLMFFFCGHGVMAGFEFALLARDFAKDAESPWDGAFSLRGLAEYMRDSTAARQVYFVDACRVASADLFTRYATKLDPLVGVKLPLNAEVEQSVYYSALGGQAAYGRINDTSLFTSALLKGLRGMGASDNDGYWAVETTVLQRALAVQMSELADPENGLVQTPQTGVQSAFEIAHIERAPHVPLYMKPSWHVGEEPPDEIATVTIRRAGEHLFEWQIPWTVNLHCSWKPSRFQSDLEAGNMYSCTVEFENGQRFTSPNRPLIPPYRTVEIPRDGDADA